MIKQSTNTWCLSTAKQTSPPSSSSSLCELNWVSTFALKIAQILNILSFLSAEPFFLFPLKDQHIDQGSQLTWHCAARGIPAPTYFWLKNGVRLQTIAGEITVTNNVLVIHNADPIRHSGMYQCGAVNKHGTSHTEGQLRVLGNI